jgi:hypothetical protein
MLGLFRRRGRLGDAGYRDIAECELHNELMVMVNSPMSAMLPDRSTYVAGYRCTHEPERRQIETWPYLAVVGQPIPSVPLALKDGPMIQLDLEGTYTEACMDHNV